MSEGYADLHVHTYYSDSTFSPREVLEKAKEFSLKAVAITDHDSIDAIDETIKLSGDYGIEVIPGIELSVKIEESEIHLLAYFIDWKNGAFQNKLKKIQEGRRERIYKMIGLLKKQGINVTPESVFEMVPRGSVTRLHMAKAILKTGKVKNIKEIFDKYIGEGKSCYAPHVMFNLEDAMQAVSDIGGVPVFAHPSVMGKDKYIDKLIDYGLKGIEVYHSDHSPRDEKKYLEIAKKHNLILTGGSDCHGLGKPRILLGTVKVPYSVVERLRKESKNYGP